MDLSQMQKEIAEWSKRNFAATYEKTWHPALGIHEELGEFSRALLTLDRPEMADAICDAAIYLLDYAGRRGIGIGEVFAPETDDRDDPIHFVLSYSGLLARGELKGDQDIREGFDSGAAKITITKTLSMLSAMAKHHGFDFEAELDATWARVKARDWKSNPETGGINQ